MKFHEAYEKVKNGEYRYIVRGKVKFYYYEGNLYQEGFPNASSFTASDITNSEWEVSEEILPENVIRDCDGNLKERRISNIYVHVYRLVSTKEISEYMSFCPNPPVYEKYNFIHTVIHSQEYSIPYEPYERRTTN